MRITNEDHSSLMKQARQITAFDYKDYVDESDSDEDDPDSDSDDGSVDEDGELSNVVEELSDMTE